MRISIRNSNKYKYINLSVCTDQVKRIKGCVTWDYSNVTIKQCFPKHKE